jgi:hypothetical protein
LPWWITERKRLSALVIDAAALRLASASASVRCRACSRLGESSVVLKLVLDRQHRPASVPHLGQLNQTSTRASGVDSGLMRG